MDENESQSTLALCSSALALAELGLGSVLHALHLPFRGQLLACNQCFLISCAVAADPEDREIPVKMSSSAALVKAMSPIGKRLTPMLALTMQGLLYRLGLFLGSGFLGRSIGALLLSLWAFVQPALLYGWIFGSDLLRMAEFLNSAAQPIVGAWFDVAWILASIVTVKASLCIGLAVVAHWVPQDLLRSWSQTLESCVSRVQSKTHKRQRGPVARVLRRLTAWPFVASMLLAGCYYAFSMANLELAFRQWIACLLWAGLGFWLMETLLLPRLAPRLIRN